MIFLFLQFEAMINGSQLIIWLVEILEACRGLLFDYFAHKIIMNVSLPLNFYTTTFNG